MPAFHQAVAVCVKVECSRFRFDRKSDWNQEGATKMTASRLVLVVAWEFAKNRREQNKGAEVPYYF